MQTSDPRKGCPSASGIERIALCPGSFRLEQTIPEAPSSEAASSGTRIHAALAGEIDPLTLSHDELKTFNECKRLQDEAIKLWQSAQ